MRWDVVVAGGGPVGLAAAIGARLAGLSAVVIEPRTGPIDKACGEGLMPGALPLLAELGVEVEGQPLRGIQYSQGSRRVIHRFAGAGGLGVRRLALHAELADRARELGVDRIVGKVGSIAQSAGSVTLDDGVEARYLLAADGLHSTVARLASLDLPEAGRRRQRYGVRQHFAVAPWSDNIEVHYGTDFELYVTPVARDTVGVALLAGRGVDYWAAIAATPDLARRLEAAAPASERRGAGPFHRRTRARTDGRILLVGDASGYVDAITGEGLRLGFAQAVEAIRCIARDRPADYEKAWMSTTRDFRVLTTALLTVATSPLRRGIVPLAERMPALYGAVVERLAR